MTSSPRQRRLQRARTLFALGVVVACFTALSPTTHSQESAGLPRVRQVYDHTLPQLDGRHLKVIMRRVTYAPGEASPPHSHPCPVIGYVLEGAVRIQIKGSPETIYKKGDSFYEAPNSFHQLTKNASDTKPARLLAYFVCDHEAPLTTPMKGNGTDPSQ